MAIVRMPRGGPLSFVMISFPRNVEVHIAPTFEMQTSSGMLCLRNGRGMDGGMDRPAFREVGFEGGRRRIKPNVFARIIRAVLRWRLLVVVLWTVLAVAGATFFRNTASIDLRADGLVGIDSGVAVAERALESAFPGTGEPIVAVVDA